MDGSVSLGLTCLQKAIPPFSDWSVIGDDVRLLNTQMEDGSEEQGVARRPEQGAVLVELDP